MSSNQKSPLELFTDKLGLGGSDEDERVPIDELEPDQFQEAIDYLNAMGEEPTQDAIEEAAWYLQNTDEDTELVSGLETLSERGRLDRQLVAPDTMERGKGKTFHTRDGDFYRIMTTKTMPPKVEIGWLDPLVLSEYDIRISTHMTPRDTGASRKELQKKLTQMKSSIKFKEKKGRTDTIEEQQEMQEIQETLNRIVAGQTRMFQVAVYFEIAADTLEELESATRSIEREVSEQGMDLVSVEAQQVEAQQAIAPVGVDPIKNDNALQVEALATMFPFIEPPIYMPDGILYGFDDSRRPVILDRYALSGHSRAISGKVGSGKTFSTLMTMYRRFLSDDDVRTIIFDPLGDDFVEFAKKLDGTVIEFGGEDRINPLDISANRSAMKVDKNPYQSKVRSFVEMMKTYFQQSGRKGMDAGQEGVINQATHYAYAKKGITPDPSTFGNESPIIDDVIEGIRIIAEGGTEEMADLPSDSHLATDGALSLEGTFDSTERVFRNPSPEHVQIAQTLLPKFESFKQGSMNANLNGQTNIELDDDIVVFDMENFADTGEMPLIMHTMLDWAYQTARQSDRRTDVTFEEAHYLLDRPGARSLINLFIRHARHFESGLTLISQTANEFIETPEKREIYDNCDVKQLFYQESVSDRVIDYFDLSAGEEQFIMQAARGEESDYSECLLSISKLGRRTLEIHAGKYEQHILDDDLDPVGWLQEKGYINGPEDLEETNGVRAAMGGSTTGREADHNRNDDVRIKPGNEPQEHDTHRDTSGPHPAANAASTDASSDGEERLDDRKTVNPEGVAVSRGVGDAAGDQSHDEVSTDEGPNQEPDYSTPLDTDSPEEVHNENRKDDEESEEVTNAEWLVSRVKSFLGFGQDEETAE